MWIAVKRFFAVAVACSIGGIAHAQIVWPLPPPTPALPQMGPTPSGVQLANNNGTIAVTIRWYQPEYLALRLSTPATHFAVCVRTPGITCEWPATPTAGVFSGTATGSIFTRTPVYSPASPFIQNPVRILVGYNYSATLTLNNTYYDRQLRWAVAACGSAAASSCISSIGNSIWYTTKELVADVSIDYGATELSLTAEGVNLGTTDAYGFSNRVTAFPALVSASGACATNPNEANLGVTNSTRVITQDGLSRLAGTLWNGTQYNTAGLNVVGMSHSTTTYSAGDVTTASNPLRPQTDPELKTVVATRYVTISGIPSNNGTRFGIVAIGRVDELGQLPEANEGDNARAECKTFAR